MKNCNCFKEMTEKIRKKIGDPELYMDSLLLIGKDWESLPAIMCYYRKTKKDGEPSKRMSKTPLTLIYCPFCGKEYNYEKEE